MKTKQGEKMLEDKKMSDYKFCYVRGINPSNEEEGTLFDLEKNWEWVESESNKIINREDFSDLIRTICDLRGVMVKGISIDNRDIETAIRSFRNNKEQTNIVESNTYEFLQNGLLRHNESKEIFLSGYGCSVILKKASEKKTAKKREYKTGLSASKSVIRTMTPYGNWKTSYIGESTEVFFDEQALYQCSNDFLADGNHHLVKGNIPTEVFHMARNLQFTFYSESDHM